MDHKAEKTVIGLVGEAGSGKTTVFDLLHKMGAFPIDVDALANQAIAKGAAGYDRLVKIFGEILLDPFGEMDRTRLFQILRSDPVKREAFRAAVNPVIRESVQLAIKNAPQRIVVLKAGNLKEFEVFDLCDHVWGTQAPREVQVTNLVWRYRWTDEQAEAYLSSQPEARAFLERADEVFSHSGSRADLIRQVSQALRAIQVPAISEARSSPARATAPALPTKHGPPTPRQPAVHGHHGREDAYLQRRTEAGQAASGYYMQALRRIFRRISNAALILLAIAYLTTWGLILAERGRERLPAQPLQAAWEALLRVGDYFFIHPQTYYWHKENVLAFQVVSETLKNSAGLLLLALGIAMLIGLPLGIAAAAAKNKLSSSLVMLISVLGVSTPSFLFAMFLWVVNIWVHRTFDVTVLPSGGFGWDLHIIMPTVVLAMRPLAQIAQVTYVSMREILNHDFIRTAYSKGLNWRLVRNAHALPNILIPTLTTLGSSLRYSLASLPVVEVFFEWPGVGLMLLDAINQGSNALVTDLILSLGLFFLIVNLLIEFSFPLIDARLRSEPDPEAVDSRRGLRAWLQEAGATLGAWWRGLARRARRNASGLPPLPEGLRLVEGDKERPAVERRRWLARHLFSNPAFLIGSLMLVALMAVAAFGEQMASLSPYQVHGVMMVDGEIGAPPYAPSKTFAWGTDHIGRDIQALVLSGGKRTLSLAFFGMLARLALGATLGVLAGWGRNGWLDRLVTNAVGVWAAFPVTLFAMLVIQALGIQQGMWVFVVAISVVGWGEVAQFVRGQVIALRPQLFIESARSVGSRPDQILSRHVIPNLINSLIVLAALEMGGILMLLAELGYLNVFMGGGFRVMLGEAGAMMPIIAFYSDVPEWAALIANVRRYWRTYPWMALYPGLAVFLAIMAFNLFGEGLRRFMEDTYSNLSRLFNRYTFIAATGLVVGIGLVLRASLPMSVYRPEGLKVDPDRVLRDIQVLSSPAMQGRETGTPGADMAAIYIAYRMDEIGILPAGERQTYMQHLVQPRLHLIEPPTLAILDGTGQVADELVFTQDFIEIGRFGGSYGDAVAPVIGAAFGPANDPELSDEFGLSNSAAVDHILLIRAGDLDKINIVPIKGLLVVADESYPIDRKEAYPYLLAWRERNRPAMLITPEIAERLLGSAGSSLAELDARRAVMQPGDLYLTGSGSQVSMSLQPRQAEDYLQEKYINVIGVIPGQGHFMGLEEQVIVVSAYYDGVGTDPTGRVYPGANDNASGVAMMLELARLLKESPYQPDKTVLFVAWAGGERQEGLSIVNVLNARPGASALTVEAVIELSGVGYGTGSTIAIGDDSSYRLVKLFQEAAGRYNLGSTTRGRNPHYGMPLPTAFGGRDAMTLSLSWDGADHLAHTPRDTIEIIDPRKLNDVGRSAFLTLLILSRETQY